MKLHYPTIEPLEARIAPAAVFTFIDVDGQLTLLDLSHATWGTEFAGANVSIAVSKLGAAPADGLVNVGEIDASGIDLGTLSVKGDLGKIIAGSAPSVVSIKSLTANSLGVHGTTTGAPDLQDIIAGSLGPLKVQSDVDGVFLQVSSGNIASITVGGSLIGGAADHSGEIQTSKVGAVKIGGDFIGGGGFGTGSFFAADALSFTLGGSLRGGSGFASGTVGLGNTTVVKIGGSLVGNTGDDSAAFGIQNATSVTVRGSVEGGAGTGSGIISSTFTVTNLTVEGSLLGGPSGRSAGEISCQKVGTLKLMGDLTGGGNDPAGEIAVTTAGTIIVGGSIFGKNNNDTGAIVGRTIGSVIVDGSINGHGGALNTDVGQGGLGSGLISATTLGSVFVGGDMDGAFIDVDGISTPATAAKALALKSVTVGGSIENSEIIVGTFTNPDVQIGSVTVHGDWVASSLVVGVQNLGTDDAVGGSGTAADNVNFGDAHDAVIPGGSAAIVAKIGSIIIGGQVTGTVGGTDHFGFVAEQIGSFKVGGTFIPLNPSPSSRDIGPTGDVSIHEV
jgi:hypothetical protein